MEIRKWKTEEINVVNFSAGNLPTEQASFSPLRSSIGPVFQFRFSYFALFSSPQDQLAVSREMLLHLLIHFLIRDAGIAHLVLAFDENLAHFLIQPVFDGQFFEHTLANAGRHSICGLGFNLSAVHKALHHFVGNVRHKITNQEHLCAFLELSVSTSVYWLRKESARKRPAKRKKHREIRRNCGDFKAVRIQRALTLRVASCRMN